MIQKNAAGLRVILPGHSYRKRYESTKSFAPHYAEFFTSLYYPYGLLLNWRTTLKNGKRYTYEYIADSKGTAAKYEDQIQIQLPLPYYYVGAGGIFFNFYVRWTLTSKDPYP